VAEHLHQPPVPSGIGLVLTHGAGGDARAPLLVALGEAFAERGVTVVRYDLPYRQASPSGPPRPSGAAKDRDGLRETVAAMRARVRGSVFLGGHSYGGRQASMLAAEDASVASALLLLSYPLHPPQRPDQPRTAHFASLSTPALFVHGTRDPFGTIAELRGALDLIPAATSLVEVAGAGHNLGGGRRVAGIDVVAVVVEAFFRFRLPR